MYCSTVDLLQMATKDTNLNRNVNMADDLQSPDVTTKVLAEEIENDKSKLNILVNELSDDYSKYLKVDVVSEVCFFLNSL